MPEATALGAALLGGLAAEVVTNLAGGAGLAPSYRTFESRAGWIGIHEPHHRRVYQPAYARLWPLHHDAAALYQD